MVKMQSEISHDKFLDIKKLKFVGVGILNTLFGYSIYAILILVKTPYLFALLASTVVGVIFNYFSFGRVVFSGNRGRFVFGKFLISYALIYFVNATFLSLLINKLNIEPYLAQMLFVPVGVCLSWLLMNSWVYKKV